uniref:WDYHV motif-containing protein 1 n=1 Tax=Anas platyrhynchos TaxID=8839 RepID=A0A8B9TCW0_ANAPL
PPEHAACAYTGCSCEENAWKLCDCIRSRGERPVEELYAVFISDERRMASGSCSGNRSQGMEMSLLSG